MQISNISFLESWLNFNCDYYPRVASIILKEFKSTMDIKIRKYLAIEIFKLVSEEIETIAMWLYTLEKCTFTPNSKIYEIYLKENVRTKEFEELSKSIGKLSPKEFREKYGIKEHVELDEINGKTDDLIKEVISLVYELVYHGKVSSGNDLLKIYNKSKHGLVVYYNSTSPSNKLEFLIGKTDSGLIDTPGFEASDELVEIMHNSITKICTPLLISIIKLKYYSERSILI